MLVVIEAMVAMSERTVWRMSRDSNGGGVSTPAPAPVPPPVDMSQWRHHRGPGAEHGYIFGPCYPGCGCEPRTEGAPTTPIPFWAQNDEVDD